ncbi:MAG: hypothetical protein HUU56_01945 [Bdellovibrionaceae bacterium]|nr:hypothetical protein [Pseudobdellovibrionaceae bacterium]
MSREQFIKLSKKFNTPRKVQKWLKGFSYNKKDTLRSAFSCYESQEAHCMEAAMLAAAILEHRGYPPLIISFESIDELDHVIFVFKEKTGWGSVGRSRDKGLHGRAPMFRSLRALAMSYFDPYVDKTGKITGYQVVHLDETKSNWRFSVKNVWKTERYLLELPHNKIKFSAKRYQRLRKKYEKEGPLLKGKHWW